VESSIDHPILHRLRGIVLENNEIVQYRGIKYAAIPGRWRDPVLLSQSLSDSEFDATHFGPSCSQALGAQGMDASLVGNVNLAHTPEPQSEFECLNLTVTVPASSERGGKGLPVVVWYVLTMSSASEKHHESNPQYRVHG
jgi:carboxylesterase type B